MTNYYIDGNVNEDFKMRFSQIGPSEHKMLSNVNAALHHSSILQVLSCKANT